MKGGNSGAVNRGGLQYWKRCRRLGLELNGGQGGHEPLFSLVLALVPLQKLSIDFKIFQLKITLCKMNLALPFQR